MSVIPSKGTISFARGLPSPDILPVGEMAECAHAVIAREGRTVLNYGPPGGYGPLREWIAERHGVSPGRVLVTPGSLQGINFVVRHLFAQGGRAVVEAPTYDRMLLVLRNAGARIDTVPLADDGLDVEALEALLAGRPAPVLVYTIPTFQNPTGRTLSLESRARLAELAAEHGLLLYEDDPYGLVRFEGKAPPSLHELAGAETVIFSSSFSKTVAPGLRVGYLVLPERLVGPLEALATSTYVSPPILPQAALFEFVQAGCFERNLERVQGLLRARRDTMLEAFDAEMPNGTAWSRPEGGYFLWLDFPPGVEAGAVLGRALEAGVSFVKGNDFYLEDGGESAARLSFSYPSVEEISEGVRRLGPLVRQAAAVAA